MKAIKLRHGLMALIGTALALALVSIVRKQRERNGPGRFARVRQAAEDMVQEVADR